MNISINNYESFIIDYLDGKLDAVNVSELLLFLEQHPEISSEFEGLSQARLSPDTVDYFDKSSLRKPSYSHVKKEYEELLVARMEKELTLREYGALLKAFQLYPELERDADLFNATKLHPDRSIVYTGKDQLKKKKVFFSYRVLMRIAAIFLVFGFSTWMFYNLPHHEPSKSTAFKKASTHEEPEPTGGFIPEKRNHESGKGFRTQSIKIKAAKSISNPIIVKEKEVPYVEEIELIHAEIAYQQEYPAPGNITLKKTDAELAYHRDSMNTTAQKNMARQEYPDLKELAISRINIEKQQLLGKGENGQTRTILEAINHVTGADIKVEKDKQGKLRHVEITALGIEWSQSK